MSFGSRMRFLKGLPRWNAVLQAASCILLPSASVDPWVSLSKSAVLKNRDSLRVMRCTPDPEDGWAEPLNNRRTAIEGLAQGRSLSAKIGQAPPEFIQGRYPAEFPQGTEELLLGLTQLVGGDLLARFSPGESPSTVRVSNFVRNASEPIDREHVLRPQLAPPGIDQCFMHNGNRNALVDGQELPRGSLCRGSCSQLGA